MLSRRRFRKSDPIAEGADVTFAVLLILLVLIVHRIELLGRLGFDCDQVDHVRLFFDLYELVLVEVIEILQLHTMKVKHLGALAKAHPDEEVGHLDLVDF